VTKKETYDRWYKKNRERWLEIRRARYSNNPGPLKTQKKLWQERNPWAVRRSNGFCHTTLRRMMLLAYGRVCACCGESQREFLALDHIDGIRPPGFEGLGGLKLYTKLRQMKWPKGFRVLCHNCNSALGYYGYCPHGKFTQAVNHHNRKKLGAM
jgi:hypothetical protein